MKKILVTAAVVCALGIGAFVIRQNLPSKRFTRHVLKARELIRAKEYSQARVQYQKAFEIEGQYEPWASLEVLKFENALAFREKSPEKAVFQTRKFLEINPGSKEGWAIFSRISMENGDFSGALAAVRRLMALEPESFEARNILAVIHLRHGRLDLAEKQFQFLAASFPDSLASLLPLAGTLFKEGKTTEARNFLKKAAALDSGIAGVHSLLADTYTLEKKFDSAHMVLDAWAAADDSAKMEMNIRKARLYMLTGQPENAEKVLYPFLAIRMENLPAISEMAMIKVKQGNYLSAVSKYESIAETFRKMSHRARFMSHLLLLKAGKPAQALEQLKRITAAEQGTVYARNFVVCYLTLGMPHKADEYIQSQNDTLKVTLLKFRKGLVDDQDYLGEWALFNFFQLNRETLWALRVLDHIHGKWPQNDQTSEVYARSLVSVSQLLPALHVLDKISTPSLDVEQLKFNLYFKTGDPQKALALASEILEKNPAQQGIRLVLADHYLLHGDKLKYVQNLRDELKVNPENLQALNNMAWEAGIVGKDFSAAVPYLDAIQRQKTNDPRILDTVGWIFAVHGKFEEAEKYLMDAVDLYPDHPSMLYHLGWLKYQRGEKSAARKLLEKSLSLKSSFPEKREAEDLVKQL